MNFVCDLFLMYITTIIRTYTYRGVYLQSLESSSLLTPSNYCVRGDVICVNPGVTYSLLDIRLPVPRG